jgi:hypothetical protein
MEAIAEYLNNSRPSSGELTRLQHHNRELALVAAEVAGKNVTGNCVFWSNDFVIQIYYRAVDLPDLELSFSVFDYNGRKVFFSTLKRPWINGNSSRMYLAQIQIPARFLAPGTYSISANVTMYDKVTDLTTFTIVADNPDHYRFGNSDIGVVTVDLEWTVEEHSAFNDA